ncbi:uncharacterized protein FFB20_15262 [Fusarium fujikuroi]|nr:Uncharacterized protein Y057_2887 [Fusarium fujikuroi]SCO12769.1 uncharacterized protein FFE2_12683 [Fusarium fujikuroi]SCO17503.1 uncharacterized protein FFB20_15262 [Fusarium fujikuroi]SCO22390.1 uncharacterized protein FFC1_14361 [Fusarium fujikuroi]SCO50796.1 uncharacterized protein FFNC_13372 [Fusarium fujikuroi]
MAPRLTSEKKDQIRTMLFEGRSISEIAEAIPCSERAVYRTQATIRRFGAATAPTNRAGPDPKITPLMRDILCRELVKEPDMLRREMVTFLRRRFDVDVSPTRITRTLQTLQWTRKNTRRVARQRNPQLRHYYHYRLKLGGYRSYHLVFLDESGLDRSIGVRRKGWAPKGVTPMQIARFQREERFQVLAAYTQRGIKLSRVYRGSTDTATFVDFVAQLLCHCGRWPEPESVLVMDNASIHCSDEIKQMCDEAGVKLEMTAPYTPDTNPIEEYFAEMKACVKLRWDEHISLIRRDFGSYVRSCVQAVGQRQTSAEGHFRNAGLTVEQAP